VPELNTALNDPSDHCALQALNFSVPPLLQHSRFASLLAGQRILITGSARERYQSDDTGIALEGIGDGIATAAAACGALKIGLNSFGETIDPRRLDYFKRNGTSGVSYFKADLTDPSAGSAGALVDRAWDTFGGLDLLVLSAGTYNEPPLLDVSPEDFDRILTLNSKSPFFAAQRFAQRVRENLSEHRFEIPAPKIIVITSINAVMAEPQHALYDGSKAFLEGTLRSWAIDYAALGISVFGVAPGLHDTPLTHAAICSDETARLIQDGAIRSGIGNASDVAQAVIGIASGLFAYCSGSIIRADGGMSSAQIDAGKIAARIPKYVG